MVKKVRKIGKILILDETLSQFLGSFSKKTLLRVTEKNLNFYLNFQSFRRKFLLLLRKLAAALTGSGA